MNHLVCGISLLNNQASTNHIFAIRIISVLSTIIAPSSVMSIVSVSKHRIPVLEKHRAKFGFHFLGRWPSAAK